MTKKESMNPIDTYIGQFPAEVQQILQEIRQVIKEAAPEAEEKISYQMPTFYLGGNLVHFAAYKKHIGFYPAPSGIEKFKQDLSKYKSAKGSVQFPINQPIPFDLIRKIVAFRVAENQMLSENKQRKNKTEAGIKNKKVDDDSER
ncbi:iron chaperone [Acetobacterium wieringae]|uniref:iron chaperone n=1 Tax=Acetobacterium wieringae TaxID=52694 RepID=UPI00350E3FB8